MVNGCLTGAGVIFNSFFSFNNCRTIQFCVSQMLPQLDLGAQFCRDYKFDKFTLTRKELIDSQALYREFAQ